MGNTGSEPVHRCKTLGAVTGRVALVGASYDDARDVMVEGESGLLSVHRKTDRPVWLSSRRELAWSNGTIGKVFSSADPECLRGSQFGAAWYESKTVWGALIAIAASVAGVPGLDLGTPSHETLTDMLIQTAGGIGGLIALFGRLTATNIIN